MKKIIPLSLALFFIFAGPPLVFSQTRIRGSASRPQSPQELRDIDEYAKDYEETLKGSSAYSRMINYFRQERELAREAPRPGAAEAVVIAAADALISLFCLGLAILVIDRLKAMNWRGYLWFLFIFNGMWLIIMFFSKMIWAMAEFLIVRLRPDLQAFVSDNFLLVLFTTAVILYVWQTARSFQLSFLGTLLVTALSHVLYLLILFSFASGAKNNDFLKLLSDNLGTRQMARNYIIDADSVASDGDLFFSLRLRFFHI